MKPLPKCKKQCGRRVKTMRTKLCGPCFRAQAITTGARSSGNAGASGTNGNAGNADASGTNANAGNADASGTVDNAGNRQKGALKETAHQRSALKRSALYALVIKKKWLDLILLRKKQWEIRGVNTTKRGWIHLAQSKAGWKLLGRARLQDCLRVPRTSFMKHKKLHCISNLSEVSYKSIFAWVLTHAERFTPPLSYDHSQGAVIWVRCR